MSAQSQQVGVRDVQQVGGHSPTWRQGSLAIPSKEALRVYIVYGLAIDLAFFSVYGLCNWVSAQRTDVRQLYFDWELGIPFVPEMLVVYLSMFVLFFVPLFQLSPDELRRLGQQVLIGIGLSGIVFLLVPGELGFERIGDTSVIGPVFAFIYQVDFPHNLVPSLHIIFSALIVFALNEASSPRLKVLYWTWLALLSVSVVLVHQHHLADVAGGFVIAVICRNLRPRRPKPN